MIVASGAAQARSARLDRLGVGEVENNRKAKYYKLTAAGRKQLEAETWTWGLFTEAGDLILKTS